MSGGAARRRSRRGFTLMETLVAMSVSALLLTAVAAILPGFVKLHARGVDLSYAKKISNSVGEALKDELSFASRIEVSPDGSLLTYTGGYGEKTVDGSADPPVIEGLAYDPAYYMRQRVSLRFSLVGQVCTVEITVSDPGGSLLYQTQRPIRAHGLPDEAP